MFFHHQLLISLLNFINCYSEIFLVQCLTEFSHQVTAYNWNDQNRKKYERKSIFYLFHACTMSFRRYICAAASLLPRPVRWWWWELHFTLFFFFFPHLLSFLQYYFFIYSVIVYISYRRRLTAQNVCCKLLILQFQSTR